MTSRTFSIAIIVLPIALCVSLADAASVSRSYSYFRIGGTTLPELQDELTSRGPTVKSTGRRHPGATEMQFVNRLDYDGGAGKCRVSKASVTVKAKITLPRWSRPAGAAEDTRLIWGALAGDIKRHEESHVSIARDYARQMAGAFRSDRTDQLLRPDGSPHPLSHRADRSGTNQKLTHPSLPAAGPAYRPCNPGGFVANDGLLPKRRG